MAKKKEIQQINSMDDALAAIERQFGKGYLIRLGDKEIENVPAISTGSITLDYALGIGGIPRGRITEIYGNEASGKTTLALHIIAEAQKAGGVAAFIDAEHALDPGYARVLGVDVDNLWVSQPDFGEQALEIAEALVRSGAVDVIAIDSVAALVPKDELDGNMGDYRIGLQARLMSQALRKLTAAVGKSRTSVIFINQIRMKIGIAYGNPETTPGGKALKFYASIRIEIRRGQSIKIGADTIGSHTNVKVVKNKMAPPFRKAEFDIIFGKGISKNGEIIDLSTQLGIVEKSGVWYTYQSERLGQGREKAKDFLEENSDIADKIENEIRIKLGFADKSVEEPAKAAEESDN